MKDNKTELLEIIEILSEKQILLVLTFIKRLIGKI